VTEPDGKLQSIWQEFVRRRVVRVAIFYGAFAWVAVQVAEVVLQAFDAENLLRYFIGAALSGFPIAIILSWMFDITPQGIQRTAPARAGNDGTRSIAVLPFANFSDDPGNEYFSDGLSEEIRDQLAKVPGLRVAARTSSFVFKGRNEDAREIGRRLDVGLILEGGVRKQESTVRISAQLVDTQKGYQLWSATFERQLQDIFKVQSEISQAILDAVHLRVLDHGTLSQPTSDFEAYNLYLLGRHHFHKRTEVALTRAMEYFSKARTRDPLFALAYSGYADAVSLLSTGYYGNLPVAESIAMALPAAERALSIAPDLAEAHASMGLIRHNQKNLDGAIQSLQHAIALRPTYTLAHVWLGVVLTSIGRYSDAATRNAEALRLDPLSPIINTNAGIDAIRSGNDREAEARFRNAIELDPAFPVPYAGMARLNALRGSIDEALMWINRAVERAPTRSFYLARKGFLYLQLGQLDRAEEWTLAARTHGADEELRAEIDLLLAIVANDTEQQRSIVESPGATNAASRAVAAWLLGDVDRALALYDEHCPDARSSILNVINEEAVWQFPHALIRSGLRLRENSAAASAEIRDFLASLDQLVDDGIVNPSLEYWAASALCLLGRKDAALDRLARAVGQGWRSLWWTRRDPNLASLATEPRFVAMLADLQGRIDASVAHIQRSDANT
jgi:TolB-like protein/tetratricopeptide (TPR) repeat protein